MAEVKPDENVGVRAPIKCWGDVRVLMRVGWFLCTPGTVGSRGKLTELVPECGLAGSQGGGERSCLCMSRKRAGGRGRPRERKTPGKGRIRGRKKERRSRARVC